MLHVTKDGLIGSKKRDINVARLKTMPIELVNIAYRLERAGMKRHRAIELVSETYLVDPEFLELGLARLSEGKK